MQKDRKKEHREVIKFMRRVNKQIGSDEYIGIDRFRIDLWLENMHRYSDGSGVYLILIFKMTDKKTGNSAYFIANNFSYKNDINMYANDFLIRCSSGYPGHYPPLYYIAYDVHEIVEYDGRKDKTTSNKSIDKWDWTCWGLFNE